MAACCVSLSMTFTAKARAEVDKFDPDVGLGVHEMAEGFKV